jgi:amino acid adenylation domain-containing protein
MVSTGMDDISVTIRAPSLSATDFADLDGLPGALIARFEAVARRYPAHVAIGSDEGDLSYAELDARANCVAQTLLRLGARGDRVAILAETGPGLFAAVLGALKAGRVVVALNPADPFGRLSQVIRDSGPVAILASPAQMSTAAAIGTECAEVLSLEDSDRASAEPPQLDITPQELAFLVYTSGSTGRPKAVMKSHGHVLHQAAVVGAGTEATPADRILMLASLSGGQGINTTFVAHLSGAALMLFPANENGVTGLDDWMVRRRISVYVSASSLFRSFVRAIEPETKFPLVRLVKVSADAATSQDFAASLRHFPNARMMSTMGSSETGHLAYAMLKAGDWVGEGRLPVGRHYPGIAIRIVDDDGCECPAGEVGNLEVRGRYLSSGYWRDPELTAACFKSESGGIQVFRGHDRGLIGSDGSLLLAGRRDATVKVRGHRVDLAEVETALAALPGIESAAAQFVHRANGDPQIVAYVALAGGAESERRLRIAARAMMARQLVPSAFVFLTELPRTPNGKIDRNRLRDLTPPARELLAEPPKGDTEAALITIWEEAFDLPGLGTGDDFFELGGDSLVAAVISARIHARFGVNLDFAAFAEAPILRDMALRIELASSEPDEVALEPVSRAASIPLSLFQENYWRTSQGLRHLQRYTRSSFIDIAGPLDVTTFCRAVAHVFARHEALRTRFKIEAGAPVQVIEPECVLPLDVIDLSEAVDAESDLAALLRRERTRDYDLLTAPLLHLTLIRLTSSRHGLLRSGHHILFDAQSWNIFLEDVGAAYDAFARGESPTQSPLPFQYADYSVWQRQRWERGSVRHREAIGWWRERFLEAPGWRARGWLRDFMRTKPATNLTQADWNTPFGLNPITTRRLEDLADAEGMTYYTVRLGVLAPIIAALTGGDTAVIGTIFTNRTRIELEPIFGLFANGVTLILRLNWEMSFRDFLGESRRCIGEAQARAEIPYDVLRTEMAAEGIDVPPHYFKIHMPMQRPPIRVAGIEMRPDKSLWVPRPTGITFRFDQLDEANGCFLTFDGRIYDPSRMRDLLVRMSRFADTVATNPEASLEHSVLASGLVAGLMRTKPVA